MENRWSDRDAEAAVERYAKAGANRDLALRTYTTRLLGAEPTLVIHGGGNTSVKTVMAELTGDEVEVLCVKGSGWDMATIEPPGLPAVRLTPLLKLARLDALSDEDMVNAQRGNLLDATSPNPSVETLLHAFLPHKFIDHTHSNAVLALTDQPDGEALCRETYGDTMGYVPYIMPGFALARKAMEVYRQNPDVEGLVLLKHGIFTFAETAEEAYRRMIDKVVLAERRIAAAGRTSVAGVALPRSLGKAAPKSFAPIQLPGRIAPVVEVAPILRGLVAAAGGKNGGDPVRWVLDFRTGPEILAFVDGSEIDRYSQQGTATPDHVIRTKPKPLLTPPPEAGLLDAFAAGVHTALEAYKAGYHAYFARNNPRQAVTKTELDPLPRIVLVPGLGLFGLGASAKEAKIVADLAETNVEVITAAETLGSFSVIPETDIFDIEYWSLEQAKLGKGAEKPLTRQVAVVTGGGSGIGAACVAALRAEGAEVAVLDLDGSAAEAVAAKAGGLGMGCDVTDSDAVARAFGRIVATYGGVDIVVSNAGAAWQGRIGEVADKVLRESFELNFWAHQTVARNAVRVMRAQGTGGCLLFNASKQALNPGPDFGPYGLPKAATLALMRQYAIDYGADGIRSSAVNADRIRSGLLTDEMVASRSNARGVSERAYMAGNLLGVEVTAADVARAFVHLALDRKTTAAVVTVDGGNIAAAVR
jgi:rhamnose utilization protein RhaD (predicted bifunctional aldolase and dehydrogenase)/NAD(P)-dependent dehydrogenase (short-subunit alcohol dehydrogenase family)